MGKTVSHKKMQYNYSTKMFTRRAKPIWIIGDIGDLDNQRPDKWSFTVVCCSWRVDASLADGGYRWLTSDSYKLGEG